jgi:shikimate dehydrogenase
MNRYGIIGKPLGHSYSERYFTELFAREGIDAQYKPYPIDHIEEVRELLKQLDGFNVTYPYKETILPYLSEIDSIAQEIGAVNVVCHGKGHNTDWIGFRNSLAPLVHSGEKALLLGTGGVSKAIQYALKEMGVEWTVVGRQQSCSLEDASLQVRGERLEVRGEGTPQSLCDSSPINKGAERGDEAMRRLGYEEVDEQVIREHRIIVNCTPLGMHPYENECPNIPYEYLSKEHLLYDCIYNPERTLFLQKGEKMGCQVKNGLEMLHRQADEAWGVFRDKR